MKAELRVEQPEEHPKASLPERLPGVEREPPKVERLERLEHQQRLEPPNAGRRSP